MLRRILPVLVLAFVAAPVLASIAALDHFFSQVKTYSAHFEQVLLDEDGEPVQRSNGELWIERPGKFRWDYNEPYEQHIVGDGKKVWIYDVGLEQVTVRAMASAIGDTPAALLAGRGKLSDSFVVTPLERPGPLSWVNLKPRNKESGFDAIRLAFEGNKLAQVEMTDGFGQITRITLTGYRENISIDPAKFRFKPPPGVDVLEQ